MSDGFVPLCRPLVPFGRCRKELALRRNLRRTIRGASSARRCGNRQPKALPAPAGKGAEKRRRNISYLKSRRQKERGLTPALFAFVSGTLPESGWPPRRPPRKMAILRGPLFPSCSAEVNSACAKVLLRKTLVRRTAPPHLRWGPTVDAQASLLLLQLLSGQIPL